MLVTYNTIKAAEKARQPWTHRLVFKGWDAKRQRHSDKWWTVSGDGSGRVEVNFGRNGSSGRSDPFRYSLSEGLKRLNEKRVQGYDVAPGHTDFREMPAERPLTGLYASIRRLGFEYTSDPDFPVAFDAEGVRVTALTYASAARLLAQSALIRANTSPGVRDTIRRKNA